MVRATLPGLSHTARVPIRTCEQAIARFCSPDKYSSSQEDEGRRIREVDGGWELVNFSKYLHLMNPEDIKEKTKIRVQKWRSRNKASKSVTPVTLCNAGNDTREDKRIEENLILSPPSSELTNGKLKKPDPRHQQFRKELETFWKYVNKGNPVPNWGPGDAGQLGRLLKEWPDLDLHGFQVWLLNYSNSDNINSLHLPKQFLPRLHEYADGPLDKYGKQEANAAHA
jgi:hypothetical protein